MSTYNLRFLWSRKLCAHLQNSAYRFACLNPLNLRRPMFQVGVDCEEISRFRRLPFDRNGRFYRRIFTPREIEYCMSFGDPYPRFAARFAAKEATIKALNSIARPTYTEIEVQKDKKEQPKIYISKNRFKKITRFTVSLSLTHSHSHAIAFTIITGDRSNTKRTKQALRKSALYIKKRICSSKTKK